MLNIDSHRTVAFPRHFFPLRQIAKDIFYLFDGLVFPPGARSVAITYGRQLKLTHNIIILREGLIPLIELGWVMERAGASASIQVEQTILSALK